MFRNVENYVHKWHKIIIDSKQLLILHPSTSAYFHIFATPKETRRTSNPRAPQLEISVNEPIKSVPGVLNGRLCFVSMETQQRADNRKYRHDMFQLVSDKEVLHFDFNQSGTFLQTIKQLWKKLKPHHNFEDVDCGPKQDDSEDDFLCSFYGWFVLDMWFQQPYVDYKCSKRRTLRLLQSWTSADERVQAMVQYCSHARTHAPTHMSRTHT